LAEGEEKRACTIDEAHSETRAVPINPAGHNMIVVPGGVVIAPACTDLFE